MSQTPESKKKQQQQEPEPEPEPEHDEDVDRFVPDEEDMIETSEYDSVEGPALTFGTMDKKTTIRVLTTPLLVSFIVSAVVVLFTFFYFTSLWDPVGNLNRMEVRVAVQDIGYTLGGGGSGSNSTKLNLGEQFMQSVLGSDATKDLLGWNFITGNKAGKYTVASVSNDLLHERYWAGLIIPANFTEAVIAAYTRGGSSYATYSNAIDYVKDEARQFTTSSVVDRAVSTVISGFDLAVRKQLRSSGLPRSASAPAGVVFNPVSLRTTNLHKVEYIGEYFATYVPLMIIWICMMFVMWVTRSGFRTDSVVGNFAFDHLRMHTWHSSIATFASFFVALCVTFFLEGIGQPMEKSVVAVFCLLWFTGYIFCGILNFLFSLLCGSGLVISTLVLVLQLVSSGGIYHIDVTAKGFKWVNRAFPFSHAVQLFRNLTFGCALDNRGLHVVVLLIWLFVAWGLSFVLEYYKVGKRFLSKIFPVNLKGYYHFIEMI